MSLLNINQNSKKEENDSTLSSSLNSNTNISDNYTINENDSSIEYNREEETKLKVNIEHKNDNKGIKKYLLYGNHIDNLKPKYIGKTRAFCYINNYPLIIIGPDCKYFFKIYKIISISRLL